MNLIQQNYTLPTLCYIVQIKLSLTAFQTLIEKHLNFDCLTASQLFTYYFVDLQVRHALAIHGYCWTRQGYIQHLEAVTMQKQCEKAKRQRERKRCITQ